MASIIGVETLQHTNGTTALSVNSSGKVILDQVGAGEFYRTGTFVPHWSSGNVTVPYETNVFTNASYEVQVGSYLRIGDLVTANINLKIDYSATAYANGGATGQQLTVYGLPFKVKNVSTYTPMSDTVYFNFSAQGWSSYNVVAYGSSNNKILVLNSSNTNGSVAPLNTNHVFHGTQAHDSQVIVQITYETDEA